MLSLWEHVLALSFPVERSSQQLSGSPSAPLLGERGCFAALAWSIGVFLLCRCSFAFSCSEINTLEAKSGAQGTAESALMAQGLTGQRLKVVVWGFGSPSGTETKQSQYFFFQPGLYKVFCSEEQAC